MQSEFRQTRHGRQARAALQGYLFAMVLRLAECGQALEAVGRLVRDPRAADEGWRQSVAQQAARLGALREDMAGAQGLPPGLKEVHASILEASDDLVEALSGLTSCAGDTTSCDMKKVTGLIAQGGERLGRSAEKMFEYLSKLSQVDGQGPHRLGWARRRPT